MDYRLLLCFIVAVNVQDCLSSSRANGTYNPKLRHTHRKTITEDIKRIMGAMKQVNITAPIGQIQNFTELVMNFVNTSYKCGSEEAAKVVPQIIQVIKGLFKIPFADYFVDSTAQDEVVKALEKCVSKEKRKERKRKRDKKRHRDKVDETEWRAFFTGAFENAEPKESENSTKKSGKNKTMTISFQSMLDDIIKSKSAKPHGKSKESLSKIILEIDDYLREEKKRYGKKGARFKSVSNRDSKKDVEKTSTDSRKDIEDFYYTKPNRESRKDVKVLGDSKKNRGYKKDIEEASISLSEREFLRYLEKAETNRDPKKYVEEINDSTSERRDIRANSEAIELKTSDEVVFDQNMEITVRMNDDDESQN